MKTGIVDDDDDVCDASFGKTSFVEMSLGKTSLGGSSGALMVAVLADISLSKQIGFDLDLLTSIEMSSASSLSSSASASSSSVVGTSASEKPLSEDVVGQRRRLNRSIK